MKRAVCAGTFDPFTNGHLQMLEPILTIADQAILAIGTNPVKEPLFTLDERIRILYEISKPYGDRVVVDHFARQYQVDYAVSRGARFIFRGLRDIKDFKEEQNWVNFNYAKDPTLAQLFLIPPEEYGNISSSMVKEKIKKNPTGWTEEVKQLVPKPSFRKILEKYDSPLTKEPDEPENAPKYDAARKTPLRGVYVSRFDPWTHLHEWIISRALDVVDELVLGISQDEYKNPTFTKQEIEEMITGELIRPYGNLVRLEKNNCIHRVDFASSVGAQILIRDIKSDQEFLTEREKAKRNQKSNPEITQVFVIPPTEFAEQTSLRVKQLIGPKGATFQGWQKEIEKLVPIPSVYFRLLEKYS